MSQWLTSGSNRLREKQSRKSTVNRQQKRLEHTQKSGHHIMNEYHGVAARSSSNQHKITSTKSGCISGGNNSFSLGNMRRIRSGHIVRQADQADELQSKSPSDSKRTLHDLDKQTHAPVTTTLERYRIMNPRKRCVEDCESENFPSEKRYQSIRSNDVDFNTNRESDRSFSFTAQDLISCEDREIIHRQEAHCDYTGRSRYPPPPFRNRQDPDSIVYEHYVSSHTTVITETGPSFSSVSLGIFGAMYHDQDRHIDMQLLQRSATRHPFLSKRNSYLPNNDSSLSVPCSEYLNSGTKNDFVMSVNSSNHSLDLPEEYKNNRS